MVLEENPLIQGIWPQCILSPNEPEITALKPEEAPMDCAALLGCALQEPELVPCPVPRAPSLKRAEVLMLKEISHLHHGTFLLNTLALDLETGGLSWVS